ncbi:hypothetical protein KAURM247S_05293 [Kitasatospora aureofaciens]
MTVTQPEERAHVSRGPSVARSLPVPCPPA